MDGRLTLLLLLVAPLLSADEEVEIHLLNSEELEPATSGISGEQVPERQVDLDVYGGWRVSDEVLDENQADFRRRRSLGEIRRSVINEEETDQDMEAAESKEKAAFEQRRRILERLKVLRMQRPKGYRNLRQLLP